MSSSNSSLLDLTDISTRKCYTAATIERPSFLPDDISTAWIPMTNDSYGAMSEICSPNPVNLYAECYLWCELPDAFMDDYEASGSEKFGFYFFDRLRETGANLTGTWIHSAREASAASVIVRPLSVKALGSLALGMFVALSV